MKYKPFCPNCNGHLRVREDEDGMYAQCYNALMYDDGIKGCMWSGTFRDFLEEREGSLNVGRDIRQMS